MKLTLEPMGDIKDENDKFLAGISGTLKPISISSKGNDVVLTGTQSWDKDPNALPVNSLVTICFKHAKIELDQINNPSATRTISDIEDVEVSHAFEPSKEDGENGYRYALLLTDEEGVGWYLNYQETDIEYKLPE